MRILLSILISIAPILGFAQTTGKVLEANAASGIQSVPNYVVNSNAEKNTNAILQSGGTLARDCSGPEVIDGTCSFDWISDTSGQYLKFTANPMNAGKLGENCSAYFRYQLDTLGSAPSTYIVVEDGSGNQISPQVTLSNTYNSVAAANDGTSRLAIIPGYPCKPSQENRFAIYRSASTSSRMHFDEIHVIDYPNPTSVPAGAQFIGSAEQIGAAGCTYNETTSSGLTNFIDLGTGSGCNAWTTTAGITAVGTNDHRMTVATIPAGGVTEVVVTGAFSNLATGNCFFRLSDGTNTFTPQVVFNGAGTSTQGNMIFYPTYSTTQTNVTFKIQASDDQASGCRYGDASAGSVNSWKFTYYPGPGLNSSVVPASCINNPDCQNVFSAKVTNAGVVSDENYDFISGNCTASNPWTCTFRTSLFSTSPTCLAMSVNTSSATNVTSVSTSSVVLTNTAGNQAFNLVCIRAGTDVKPWGPIPWLTGMVSSNSTSSIRSEFAGLTCSAASTIDNQSALVTSIANAVDNGSTRSCALTISSGFSAGPRCTATQIVATAGTVPVALGILTGATSSSVTVVGPDADYSFNISCPQSRN